MPSTTDTISRKVDDAVDSVEEVYDSASSEDKQQFVMGAGTGLLCGHFTAKSGPWVAAAGGLALIALQYARQKGYIRMDRSSWKNDVRGVAKRVGRQWNKLYDPNKPEIKVFVEKNCVLLASYAACVLLGAVVTAKLL